MSEDTEVETVELELKDVENIVLPADALKDALDGLPDNPTDEVAMVTDSVIVAGDGDSGEFVRVFRPSGFPNIGSDSGYKYWYGLIPDLYNMIDEARTLDGAEYVRENVVDDGSVSVEQYGTRVYITSYMIEDNEIRAAVADDRMEVEAVEPTTYRGGNGLKMRMADTDHEDY